MRSLFCFVTFFALTTHAGITVPLDIGVGPAGYWFFGPLVKNRGAVPHFALHVDLAAVVDRQTIQNNLDKVPARFRGMASGLDEVRIGPSIFIPSALIISPKISELGGVGMFGVSWTPLGLGLINVGRGGSDPTFAQLRAGVKLLLTTAVIYSDVPEVPLTFFLRPGAQLDAEAVFRFTSSFGLGLGMGGQAYLPQQLGSFGFGPFEESIVFAAFASLKVHVRLPYEANL